MLITATDAIVVDDDGLVGAVGFLVEASNNGRHKVGTEPISKRIINQLEAMPSSLTYLFS